MNLLVIAVGMLLIPVTKSYDTGYNPEPPAPTPPTTPAPATTTTRAPATAPAPAATAAPATTPAPLLAPCLALAPGRECTDPVSCETGIGDRILTNLACVESPSNFVCCQQGSTAASCPDGDTSVTNSVNCLELAECDRRNGTLLNMGCGDGPELCCLYLNM